MAQGGSTQPQMPPMNPMFPPATSSFPGNPQTNTFTPGMSNPIMNQNGAPQQHSISNPLFPGNMPGSMNSGQLVQNSTNDPLTTSKHANSNSLINGSGDPGYQQQSYQGMPSQGGMPLHQQMNNMSLNGPQAYRQNGTSNMIPGRQVGPNSMTSVPSSGHSHVAAPPPQTVPNQPFHSTAGQNQIPQAVSGQNQASVPPMKGQNLMNSTPLSGQNHTLGNPDSGQNHMMTQSMPGRNQMLPPSVQGQGMSGPSPTSSMQSQMPPQSTPSQNQMSAPTTASHSHMPQAPHPVQPQLQQQHKGMPGQGFPQSTLQQNQMPLPPISGQNQMSGRSIPNQNQAPGMVRQNQVIGPGQSVMTGVPGQFPPRQSDRQQPISSQLPPMPGPQTNQQRQPPYGAPGSAPGIQQQPQPFSQYGADPSQGNFRNQVPSQASNYYQQGGAGYNRMGQYHPPGQNSNQYGNSMNQPPGYPPAEPTPPAPQQKSLDPELMPSAVKVMLEDQRERGGTFQTSQKGKLPPLVTTKFVVEDMGNASPRFIRSTMYSVPAQPDMLKNTAIPFALLINPFASVEEGEQPLASVNMSSNGPVRCIRCKAYMSPLMQFIDGGRRFQCTLCKATTEVPPEYFQHLDHTGKRVDKWERPELWKGSYELFATTEYCRNSVMPKEPGFIFVIDVSYNNVKSGLVDLLCSHMRTLIQLLPPRTPVGFVTYNSKVHFYNIDPSLGQPQMVIVPDVADIFMPLLKGFLVPREEAVEAVESLMEKIPAMFNDTKETEAVLGPAIQAAKEALKASERVGKMIVFHSSLPSSENVPGKLKNREADRKLLGTDKEKSVLTPQNTYYNNLAQDCVTNGVSVDLFLFNNSYIDVATIGQVARITGGTVNKFTYFQADIDGSRVLGELSYHLSQEVAFDAVMRVRTSTGVRPVEFYGHFYMSNSTDVELAAIDGRKGIGVEIKHDDKLTDEDGVYIQVALLYTSMHGERKLRIHNLQLDTCTQMAELYRSSDQDTIINFIAKQSISKIVESTPQAIRENVISQCAQMLALYRKYCADPSDPSQLIIPECLILLPLYINCVLKSDALAGNSEITPDDKSWLMYTVMQMGVRSSVHYFYPKLTPVGGPLADLNNPLPIRCSRLKLREDCAFILENGIYIFLWIGDSMNPEWLNKIFGVSNLAQLNVETITELPDINTDESLRLRAFIRSIRSSRERHMRLTVVKQRDKMEPVMHRFLVEDRTSDAQPSYVDFLCHMHKEIRNVLYH